ncbi:MAG: hypothetical protein H6687_02060 [Bacillales bacterium]|nr:hypothetical protein [Bacillales bacterium]
MAVPNKKIKVMFMYNPSSGKGRVQKNLGFITAEITKKYGSCDVVKTESKDHLKETVVKACQEYDYFFFSGGDGTFNMVVNSIPNLDHLPVFGYLPGGSTNDMSYNLNISKNIKRGIFDLLNSKPKKYNVGYIGDTNFIYVADFGVFTDIPHITPADQKRKFGTLAYAYYGVKSVFRIKTYTVTVDGVIYKTPFMFVSNSREVASFRINPETRQNEGNYYACVVKDGPIHGIFNLIYLFAFGLERAIKAKKVVSFTSSIFKLNCDNDTWDVDGEKVVVKFPVTCGYSGRSIMVFSNRE